MSIYIVVIEVELDADARAVERCTRTILATHDIKFDSLDVCERPDNVWDEDEKYPRSSWQYEVGEGDTSLGYWQWVAHRKEIDELEAQ